MPPGSRQPAQRRRRQPTQRRRRQPTQRQRRQPTQRQRRRPAQRRPPRRWQRHPRQRMQCRTHCSNPRLPCRRLCRLHWRRNRRTRPPYRHRRRAKPQRQARRAAARSVTSSHRRPRRTAEPPATAADPRPDDVRIDCMHAFRRLLRWVALRGLLRRVKSRPRQSRLGSQFLTLKSSPTEARFSA